MNLRDLFEYKLSNKREMLIGRESVIADKPVLMLGLQEVCNEDYYYSRLESGLDPEEEEFHTILYLLYEDEPDDENWEEEIEDPITIRQHRMNDIEAPYQPQVSGVEVFVVDGKRFPVSGMTNGQLNESFSYHQGHMISSAAIAGVIPDHWLAIDERRLWCCEYELDLEAFNTKWSNVDSSIDVIMEKPSIEVFVGEKMLMNPGHNQEPTIITFKDPCDKTVEVAVHGLHVKVLPGWPDEEGEEASLFIEYEAPANLQMNFYRTDYLDASQSDNESGIFAMACDDQNSNVRYDYIGLAPNVFDESIEVELFSYYILEQEELPMKADVAKR